MLKTNVKNEWVNVYLNEQLLSNYGHNNKALEYGCLVIYLNSMNIIIERITYAELFFM